MSNSHSERDAPACGSPALRSSPLPGAVESMPCLCSISEQLEGLRLRSPSPVLGCPGKASFFLRKFRRRPFPGASALDMQHRRRPFPQTTATAQPATFPFTRLKTALPFSVDGAESAITVARARVCPFFKKIKTECAEDTIC